MAFSKVNVDRMEDEEDKSPVKCAHKPKSKKDAVSESDQKSDEEREEYVSRHCFRESRDKVKKHSASLSGNSNASEHGETELQQIYRVVECLLTAPGYSAFMERPDNTVNGMTDYYEIITNPMWLEEVVRKYEEGLYKSAAEVAADVRLIFGNCYRYWGPSDILSNHALKLEQLFEQKLSQTSIETQKLCCLAATHEMDIEDQSDESTSDKLPSEGNVNQPSRRSVSTNKKDSLWTEDAVIDVLETSTNLCSVLSSKCTTDTSTFSQAINEPLRNMMNGPPVIHENDIDKEPLGTDEEALWAATAFGEMWTILRNFCTTLYMAFGWEGLPTSDVSLPSLEELKDIVTVCYSTVQNFKKAASGILKADLKEFTVTHPSVVLFHTSVTGFLETARPTISYDISPRNVLAFCTREEYRNQLSTVISPLEELRNKFMKCVDHFLKMDETDGRKNVSDC